MGMYVDPTRKTSVGGVIMADSFHCPNCYALYKVVKVEAGPETPDAEIACRNCGGPLTGREGNLVLKYFLVQRPERVHRLRKVAR
jgi:hypothetical protein